jgi:hypothetical protein
LRTTLRRGHAIFVERDRYCRQSGSLRPFANDPIDDLTRQRPGPTESDAAAAYSIEGSGGSLRDKSPRVLSKGCRYVSHYLASRSRGINRKVKDDHPPPLAIGPVQQRGEVEE